jgi:hypothetical protein
MLRELAMSHAITLSYKVIPAAYQNAETTAGFLAINDEPTYNIKRAKACYRKDRTGHKGRGYTFWTAQSVASRW